MGKFSKVAAVMFLLLGLATSPFAQGASLSGQVATTFQQAPSASSDKRLLQGREYSLQLENPQRGLRLSYWTATTEDNQGNLLLTKNFQTLSAAWKEKALTSDWGRGYFFAGIGGATTYSTTRISTLTDIESDGPRFMGFTGMGAESDILKYLRFGAEVRLFFLEDLPPSPFLQGSFFIGIVFP
jgi:hypothetical protein